MSYTFTIRELAAVLHSRAPALADAVSMDSHTVEHGLLSVGLKLHCLKNPEPFVTLINELGGFKAVCEVNYYRQNRSWFCLVLPPVGSAKTAIRLLEAIEHYTGTPIFNTPDIQIQVCSPGRLGRVHTGMLTMAFYLGSEVVRLYKLADLETTFSEYEWNAELERGRRLVLYDAPYGTFDKHFEWWGYSPPNRTSGRKSALWRWPELPFSGCVRTDVLTARTKLDIQNINLVATLLCHIEHNGYWKLLGRRFQKEMEDHLAAHQLQGLLLAPWVRTEASIEDDIDEEDQHFLSAMKELLTCAMDEVFRANKVGRYAWKNEPRSSIGLLWGMHEMLRKYRKELIEESRRVTHLETNGGRR